mgnify:CR=1 FL=1
MSTRSRIGIQNENGSVTSIYCHYDGYPEGVGKELVENYNSPDKINNLLSKGDMSSIHSNEHYKDRGETNVDAMVSANEQAYVKDTDQSWGEYAYLYRNGEWEVCPIRGEGNKFTPVQSLLKEEA